MSYICYLASCSKEAGFSSSDIIVGEWELTRTEKYEDGTLTLLESHDISNPYIENNIAWEYLKIKEGYFEGFYYNTDEDGKQQKESDDAFVYAITGNTIKVYKGSNLDYYTIENHTNREFVFSFTYETWGWETGKTKYLGKAYYKRVK